MPPIFTACRSSVRSRLWGAAQLGSRLQNRDDNVTPAQELNSPQPVGNCPMVMALAVRWLHSQPMHFYVGLWTFGTTLRHSSASHRCYLLWECHGNAVHQDTKEGTISQAPTANKHLGRWLGSRAVNSPLPPGCTNGSCFTSPRAGSPHFCLQLTALIHLTCKHFVGRLLSGASEIDPALPVLCLGSGFQTAPGGKVSAPRKMWQKAR